MTPEEMRYAEIDALVESSGHSFNPNTDCFEASVGSDAENNLDHDWQSITGSLGEPVTEVEFRGYMAWKSKHVEDKHYEHEAEELLERHEEEKQGA